VSLREALATQWDLISKTNKPKNPTKFFPSCPNLLTFPQAKLVIHSSLLHASKCLVHSSVILILMLWAVHMPYPEKGKNQV
jgi:hypothetical protein